MIIAITNTKITAKMTTPTIILIIEEAELVKAACVVEIRVGWSGGSTELNDDALKAEMSTEQTASSSLENEPPTKMAKVSVKI